MDDDLTSPMTDAQQKGDTLETAVRAIEAAILRTSPSYSDKTFSIESKKIIVVAGVHHEIDIWVAVELSPGYDAVFIFECKNWQDKVGKNEIIIFAEKIRAAQAQRGFFVAHSFTADAESQAANEPRITLLRVTDLPVKEIPVPLSFHMVHPELKHVDVQLKTGIEGTPPLPVDVETASCSLDGTPWDLKKYIGEWATEESTACANRFRSEQAAEGVHDLTFNASRDFSQNQTIVNGQRILQMNLAGKMTIQVARARVVSHFEVHGRGRAVTVLVDFGKPGEVQGTVTATFVSPPRPS